MTEVINFLDEEYAEMPLCELLKTVLKECGIKTYLIEMKIVKDFSHRKDVTYKIVKSFTEFYETIDDLLESNDCKNGCAICEIDFTKQRFFTIRGSLYYDKETGKCLGEDNVKVFFKDYKMW